MPGPVRPMLARDRHEHHRAATQLELLFDLVSVIAIASLTAEFHHAISAGHGVEALSTFAFLFVAIWVAWLNYTWFASAFDNDDALTRFWVFVIMAGELIFAGGIGHIFATLDMGLGILGWIVMRIGMIALWLRAARANPALSRVCYRYAIGIGAAQVLWTLAGIFATPGSFFPAVILIFLIELAVPIWSERDVQTPWHRHHVIERYGLLNIIVLGEALLSASFGAAALYEHFDYHLIVDTVALLGIVFPLFWLYFCEADHLPSDSNRFAFQWGYGHVLLFGAAAMIGAGGAAWMDLAGHHSEIDAAEASRWIGVPVAVYLASLWFVRDRWLARGIRGAALPVMSLAILAAALAGVPVWGYPLLLLVALIWRVPLSFRD